MKPLATFLVLLLACFASSATAGAACPADSIWIARGAAGMSRLTVTTDSVRTDSLYDLATNHSGCSPEGYSSQAGSYDLGAGHLRAIGWESGGSYMCGAVSPNTQVSSWDDYTLTGPESIEPVSFTAELGLEVYCSGGRYYFCLSDTYCLLNAGCVSASLAEGGAANSAQYSNCSNTSSSPVISIPISRLPGESFRLNLRCTAEASSFVNSYTDEVYHRWAQIAGNLRFTGLPDGYRITSCQGYDSHPGVPVRERSWGSLKTRYH